MIDAKPIRARYAALSPQLDERGRRCFAASEARAAGYGGIAATARATGIARSTIGRGLKDLADGSDLPAGRMRRPGGGRKPLTEVDTTLSDDLLALVWPSERGDPMSPAALDVQEPAADRVGTEGAGAPDQSHGRWRTSQARGVQPASQPQDARGRGPR